MKRILFIAIAALMSLPAIAQTQYLHQITVAETNLFLHDDLSTPLHLRIPSGPLISSAYSTNSATAEVLVIGSSLWVRVYNWSEVRATDSVLLYSGINLFLSPTNANSVINDDASIGTGNSRLMNLSNAEVGFGASSRGNIQHGFYASSGVNLIGESVDGSGMLGNYASGTRSIGYNRDGCFIFGSHSGDISLTNNAAGAFVLGRTLSLSSVSNRAAGGIWIGQLDPGEHAILDSSATGSVLIGPGTNTDDHALVVSDSNDGSSKGDGTIYATGGDWSDNFGSINNATGTPSHLMNRDALYTNFVRQTTFNPSSSSDSGAPYQSHLEPIDATSAWFSVYSGTSSLWYRVKLGTF